MLRHGRAHWHAVGQEFRVCSRRRGTSAKSSTLPHLARALLLQGAQLLRATVRPPPGHSPCRQARGFVSAVARVCRTSCPKPRFDSWERVGGTGEGKVYYPTFSPDARWLAFVSNESGQAEVLVKPFGRPGGSEQVSVGGGWSPLWSEDGRHIDYRTRGDALEDRWIMAVDVNEADVRLELSAPRKLFRDEFGATSPIRQWDMLGPDRFLLVLYEDEDQQQARLEDLHPERLIFIQNWATRVGGK